MKVGIVGLGLIGGSLALAGTSNGHEMYGSDSNLNEVKKAIDSGSILSELSISEMAQQCDVIILCVPTVTAKSLLDEALSGKAIVTDVASVKGPICNYVASLDSSKIEKFIGGHPMAGSEQSGYDSARADLFKSKMWIVVPPSESSLKHVDLIETFVTSIGMEHCLLSPENHDEIVASISHLPHLASFALMNMASDKAHGNEIMLRLAGGGFRDMTRIAASNSKMWIDIVKENKNEILQSLNQYIDDLNSLVDDINSENIENLEKLFAKSATARNSLPDAARRLDDLIEIYIPVPDMPGVLTQITSLASDVNIYDIKIVHALEEDRGVLSLVVSPEQSNGLVEKLKNAGFNPSEVHLSKKEADE